VEKLYDGCIIYLLLFCTVMYKFKLSIFIFLMTMSIIIYIFKIHEKASFWTDNMTYNAYLLGKMILLFIFFKNESSNHWKYHFLVHRVCAISWWLVPETPSWTSLMSSGIKIVYFIFKLCKYFTWRTVILYTLRIWIKQ
jgi:hypothetical protein